MQLQLLHASLAAAGAGSSSLHSCPQQWEPSRPARECQPDTVDEGSEQAAGHHWWEAQDLQHHITTGLIALHASLILSNAGHDALQDSRVVAAAKQALQAAAAMPVPHSQLPTCSALLIQPREEQLAIQGLLQLQDQQQWHLEQCAGRAHSMVRTGSRGDSTCRTTLAADANRSQESLLLACSLLLQHITDALHVRLQA